MGGPQTSKNRVAEWLGGVLGGSLGNLGTSWVLLVAFWASWRGLGGILGGTWSILDGFWSRLETFWVHLGASWEALGELLEDLGGFQLHFGNILLYA